jgi:hypothetical protein
MRKAMVAGMICLVSVVLAAMVLLAQSQSTKPATDASATNTNAKALAAQMTPLNMNTGLWQTTLTGKYMGLPPEMAQMAAAMGPTMTYKVCVKAEELTRNEWAKELVGLKCSSVTVLSSTTKDVDVQGKGCNAGNGITADGRGTFELQGSNHLTGTMDVTFNGNPFAGTPFAGNSSSPVHMHADYTSNWIGATCPADMK